MKHFHKLCLALVSFTLWAMVISCAFAAGAVTDTRESRFAKLQPVGLEEVAWTPGADRGGFWAERMDVLRSRSIPAMWEIMKGNQYKPYLQHFLIAAGEMEGRYRGAQWNDGDFYKFLEGVTATYAVTRE